MNKCLNSSSQKLCKSTGL